MDSDAVPLISISRPCAFCSRPTSLWCSRCESAWYCNRDHFREHWSEHRKVCIPANPSRANSYNIIATPPPAEPQLIHVSAILFLPEADRPEIISIDCRPSQSPSQGMCPTPLVHDYFQESQIENIVLTQGLNGEPLRFPLHLWYSHSAFSRGTPFNRAIDHITSGAAEKPWYGTVVVLKFNGSRRQAYAEAGPNDFPALSAYFLAYTVEPLLTHTSDNPDDGFDCE